MYHSTTPASAAAIRRNGFDLAHAGEQGGAEFGAAVYLCPTWDDLDAWRADFRWFGVDGAIIEVTCNGQLFDMDGAYRSADLLAWTAAKGWTDATGVTDAGRAKIMGLLARWGQSYNPENYLIVEMLQEQGYDGLLCSNGSAIGKKRQAVVWNISTLKIEEGAA